VSGIVEGVGGNREVPPFLILVGRADMGGAPDEAGSEEEGGSWGKHGFPRATEPEAKEDAA
jgi:hypothetical protein